MGSGYMGVWGLGDLGVRVSFEGFPKRSLEGLYNVEASMFKHRVLRSFRVYYNCSKEPGGITLVSIEASMFRVIH